jgi:putative ABC transport system permease protein
MSILAWRNLVHDRVRFAVTLTGIVFAVVLIVVEFGLFLGFTTTTSSLVDRSGADLWIIAKHVPYIELASHSPSVARLSGHTSAVRPSSVATLAEMSDGRWRRSGVA